MKNRKVKLILILSTVLLLLFTSLNVAINYMKMKETIEESIANQSLESAKSIASAIDIDTYQQFLKDPVRNKYYWEIRGYLHDAKEKLGALYVYTLVIDNPKVSNVMIMGLPEDDINGYSIGQVCTVPEVYVKQAFYEETAYVTGVIEDTQYDTAYISVGAPIKDQEGNVIGYLGIDTSADTLSNIEKEVLENNVLLFVFNGAFIIIVVVSFAFMQRWYQKEVAKEVGDTEDTYQAEIKTLITSISSLRHDFTNHVQVVHGLLQLEAFDQAKQYLFSLSNEVQAIESIKLNIDHPGLAILMQMKKLAAQNHQIKMDVTISQNAFNQMKTTDLIKILSNLVDNAIDATIELPEAERKITIDCQVEAAHYVFKIANTGPKIIGMEDIFKQGYSTKKVVPGKIRGQGLFIVKEVVHKYNGSISIDSNELETTAIVKIPLKQI